MILGRSIGKNSIIMGLFAVFTTGLIVLTQVSTAEQIQAAQRIALERSLQQVVPAALFDNKLLEDTAEVAATAQLGSKQTRTAYIAKKAGVPVAAILQATAPEGYGGSINLLVGINANGDVTGVRVVPPHFETPGLGDKIDLAKADWILEFNGKNLSSPNADGWKVKKDGGDFDAFTGATITPRAVVDGVHKSLLYFNEQKLALFGTQTLSSPPSHTPQPSSGTAQ